MRLAVLLILAAVLAGCGGATVSKPPVVSTAAAPKPGPGQVLYQGGAWAVVVDGKKAVAEHLAGGAWVPDTSGAVRVTILGPRGTVAPVTQLAAELSAKQPLVESGLWVDGVEQLVKGGGLKPNRGTIYGAPANPLASGVHTIVAYARTDTHATAVAATFRVR